MEFNQIGKNFNSDFSAPARRESKSPAPFDARKEEAKKENSPVDPKYWQSQRGISFTGGAKMLESDELKNTLLIGLNRIWDKEAQERYKLLAEDWVGVLPSLTTDEVQAVYTYILPSFANDGNFFDKKREFLKEFLADDKYSTDEKIGYISLFAYDNLSDEKKFDEFLLNVQGGMSAYSRFRKTIGDKDGYLAQKCRRNYDFAPDTFNKLSDIVESGKIKGETLNKYFTETLPSWLDKSAKAALFECVDRLYELNDEDSYEDISAFFENLTSDKFLQSGIKPLCLSGLLAKALPFRAGLVNYFADETKNDNSQLFYNDSELLYTVNQFTPETFEDFKTCRNLDANKNKTINELLSMARNCVNPKTKTFDIKIYDLLEDFKEKAKTSPAFISDFYLNEIAKGCVDMQSGEISDIALDFLDKYYFQNKAAKKDGKIERLVKKIKYGTGSYSRRPFYKDTLFIDCYLQDLLGALKDKNGAFSETNAKYVSDIVERPIHDSSPDFDFLNSMKDENGIIQKNLYKMGLKILDTTNSSRKAKESLDVFGEYGKNTAQFIYSSLDNIFNSESSVIWNFPACAKNCFDKDGGVNEENLNFVMDLADCLDSFVLEDEIFEVIQNKDNREMFLKYTKDGLLKSEDLSALARLIKKYSDKDGDFDSFVKEKLEYGLKSGVGVDTFRSIFEKCTQDNKNYKENFDKEKFYKAADICGVSPDMYWYLGGSDKFFSLINGEFDIKTLDFKGKVKLFEDLKAVKNNISDKYPVVDKIMYEIDGSLSCDNISLPVDDEVKRDFMLSVVGNTGVSDNELSPFETTMKDSIPFLKEMKNGLKITYPREKFLNDLSNLCNSEEKLKTLADKTSITLITDDNNKITGYNGVMLLDKLNKEDYFEKKIYEICHKFFYENEVKTGNKALDEQMNTIIKACPEFLNTVGKPQHGTHQYSLDIHQLLVLANSINNPDYLKLNNSDKAMLKIACLFHDIAKQESIVDRGHQNPSSIYTRSIIKKFFNNPEARDRVYELVKNHHWLEELANDSSDEKAKELAFRFRRPNDFDIAKIMAKSDLMAVSDSFYETYKHALDTDKLKPVEDNLKYIYSTGCAVFSDYPIAPSKLEEHTETFNGNEYKVINFHNMKDSDDLGEYGFMPGVTKKDARLLVHMVDSNSIAPSLDILKKLTSSVNEGALSESLITPKYKKTYANRQYGVLLSHINSNVINIGKTNQGSGVKKELDDIIRLLYCEDKDVRKSFRRRFLSELNINPDKVSDEDYALFYKNYIARKTFLSQFVDDKEYELGEFKLKGSEIKNAIIKSQDEIIDKKEFSHNEIVGFAPKIQGVVAKAKALSEVPLELLEFARENNLPVVLI